VVGMDVAGGHDLIRVSGARENNLKDVSVEIPKRRLTVFTGVSGSGKSSLVVNTIAAESQRLINETYSAFLQGFMPTLARPDVDVLEGLTTAIIVDQERMSSDTRSTVGTATDVNAMLRILFARLGEPHIGPPNAFSFNVPSVRAAGSITVERGSGKGKTVRKTYSRAGGMCPHCEGRGTVSDIDLTQLYDDSMSLAEGAITIPGYKKGGWAVRAYTESGFVDADKPIRDFSEQELADFLYKEPVKVRMMDMNVTYEGLILKVKKSFFSKDRGSMRPHIRAFVDRAALAMTISFRPTSGYADPVSCGRDGQAAGSDRPRFGAKGVQERSKTAPSERSISCGAIQSTSSVSQASGILIDLTDCGAGFS